MPFGLTQNDVTLMCESFKRFPEIEEVVIFGSRAMGSFKKGSDVDFAVKGDKVTYDTVAQLNTVLNEELPIPYVIDVLDYSGIKNKALLKHIGNYGKKFYSLDKNG